MTGDPHVPRCDWLQQARIEISSNTIIFHDETFVKMVTVEDIINRLSEERQRCYRAHSDAEARPQESNQPVIGCWYYDHQVCGLPHPAPIAEEHDDGIRRDERKKVLSEISKWRKEMEAKGNEGDISACAAWLEEDVFLLSLGTPIVSE